MNTQFRAAAVLLMALPTLALADDSTDPIDEIVVEDHTTAADASSFNVQQEALLDAATSLKSIPGADVNSNGLITGIAQYRGMYGDRVAISIDNHVVVSGGPNSMDAPLSYVSPMITEAIEVKRGIASVSSAPEAIGGHLNARLARGSFGAEDFGVSGFVGSRYSANGNITTSAGRFTLANSAHRISALMEFDTGDDISTPAGDIRPSSVDRRRYDVSYAYNNGEDHFVVFAGKLDTSDSGTPALPMDVRLIDTDLVGGHFRYSISPAISVEGRASANDVEHIMDNFGLRSAPPAMMQRETLATGSGRAFAFAAKIDLETSTLRLGVENALADHNATITNPNNGAFRIANFSNVERDRASIFGEWLFEREAMQLELGAILKHVTTTADPVSAAGIMSPAVAMLADTFNNADRDLSFDDVDGVLKYRYRATGDVEWHFEVARKTRAPSYQELYLWLPMQSTGGLADGRSYIGDLNLHAETSNEANIGFDSRHGRLSLSPQVFFKRIDGFIQGTPSVNTTANNVAMMMAGKPVLQFANTDAEIWGVDLAWALQVSERLLVDGIATYARGRRTDVSDNLYRLAPLNASMGLTYAAETWGFNTRIVAYGSQKEVAAFNNEQPTPGYEILSAGLTWTPTSSLRVEARIDNLFDTNYQDHLAGINRAGGSDIAVGSKLYGAERTLGAGIIYRF